jgi:uncharacterized iron-regulated protein
MASAGRSASTRLTAGCAVPAVPDDAVSRVDALLPADALLLGEQHDSPDHQRIHRQVIDALVARGVLAAVALEMAPQGGSTSGLPRDADEAAVQAALKWTDASWPWKSYAPAVMAAVRSGVPVLGANLPRAQMRTAMAESDLDALLPGPALKAQQQAIRLGHCDRLPESQIAPMTRVQIARDRAMAQTVASLALPGKTVVLIAGARHVDRQLGVPKHLPAGLRTKVVALRAGAADDAKNTEQVDTTWATPAVPPKDYCAEVRVVRPADQAPAGPGAGQMRQN